ncbi:MAG: hypothetical protein FWD13_09570 [Treponema sp.]|nr:hypothetical protein [Treponema sp.]
MKEISVKNWKKVFFIGLITILVIIVSISCAKENNLVCSVCGTQLNEDNGNLVNNDIYNLNGSWERTWGSYPFGDISYFSIITISGNTFSWRTGEEDRRLGFESNYEYSKSGTFSITDNKIEFIYLYEDGDIDIDVETFSRTENTITIGGSQYTRKMN